VSNLRIFYARFLLKLGTVTIIRALWIAWYRDFRSGHHAAKVVTLVNRNVVGKSLLRVIGAVNLAHRWKRHNSVIPTIAQRGVPFRLLKIGGHVPEHAVLAAKLDPALCWSRRYMEGVASLTPQNDASVWLLIVLQIAKLAILVHGLYVRAPAVLPGLKGGLEAFYSQLITMEKSALHCTKKLGVTHLNALSIVPCRRLLDGPCARSHAVSTETKPVLGKLSAKHDMVVGYALLSLK
jgi:hypothetical protein